MLPTCLTVLTSKYSDYFYFSKSLIITLSILGALVIIFLAYKAIRAHANKVSTGQKGMTDDIGEAYTDVSNGKLKVFIHSEIWNAESSDSIKKGEKIKVTSIKDLTLHVKKV